MSDVAQLIADNYVRVCQRVAAAAKASGRQADAITIIGVTKYVGTDEAAALLAAGCTTLGESRPQQLWDKAAAPDLARAQWHMIGHLQRNKVRRSLPLLQMIHSVDSLRLAQAIDKEAASLNQPANILLEVNCSGEAEKHGFAADELPALLPQLAELTHVQVRGLMTMAAREGGTSVAAQNFETLRTLRDKLLADCPADIHLTELSMGMSHDFETAIQAGATMVRIGSLLFEGVPRR